MFQGFTFSLLLQLEFICQIYGFVSHNELGLLSGHGTMSLERLHTMLKLLAGGTGGGTPVGDLHFDMSVQQLRTYLQSMVDQAKIECIDGVYSLCSVASTTA